MTYEQQTTEFNGESGKSYIFAMHDKTIEFRHISAVYIFAEKSGILSRFYPLYIGESSELGTRIANHEKWDSFIIKTKCTHICIMPVKGEKHRMYIETDLRHYYKPLCNEQ
jgi:hypothetical protein